MRARSYILFPRDGDPVEGALPDPSLAPEVIEHAGRNFLLAGYQKDPERAVSYREARTLRVR